MTGVTFSEECQSQNAQPQDLDDWDDVGLNISKPPTLIQHFRFHRLHSTTLDMNKIDFLKSEISLLNQENLALKREIETKHRSGSEIDSSPHPNPTLYNVNQFNKISNYTTATPATPTTNVGSPSSDALNDRIATNLSRFTIPEEQQESVSIDTTPPVTPQLPLLAQPTPVFKSEIEHTAFIFTEGSALSNSASKCDDDSFFTSKENITRQSIEVINEDYSQIVDTEAKSDDSAQHSILNNSSIHSIEAMEHDTSRSIQDEASTPQTSNIIIHTNDQHDTSSSSKSANFSLTSITNTHVERSLSLAFRQSVLSIGSHKREGVIEGASQNLLSEKDPIKLLATSLPVIIPNMLFNKREEVVPLLLLAISSHPNKAVKDNLLNLLFNLFKRPNSEQRQLIISSCIIFAKQHGVEATENELLPQCWEQLNHKYSERRMVVADSCGALIPYISSQMRSSLIFSVLQQMQDEEKDEDVKSAVVRSLGVLAVFVDDSRKFNNFFEILVKCLPSNLERVIHVTLNIFLPALAGWSYELKQLEHYLIVKFIDNIDNTFKVPNMPVPTEIILWLNCLELLLPWQLASLLIGSPFADQCSVISQDLSWMTDNSSPLLDIDIILGHPATSTSLKRLLSQHCTNPESSFDWKEAQWFQEIWLKRLIKIIKRVTFQSHNVIHKLCQLFISLTSQFGKDFTERLVLPEFRNKLSLSQDKSALATGSTNLSTPLLSVFIVGVLSTLYGKEDLKKSITDILVEFASHYVPLESLLVAFSELKQDRDRHELLVHILREVSFHVSIQVKCYAGNILVFLIRDINEGLISRYVIPTLDHLSQDKSVAVVCETVPAYSHLLQALSSRDLLQKCELKFIELLDYGVNNEHQLLMKVLAEIQEFISLIGYKFRDEMLLPKLKSISDNLKHSRNQTIKHDVSVALVAIFKSLHSSSLDVQIIEAYIKPTLVELLHMGEEIGEEFLRDISDVLMLYDEKYNVAQQPTSSTATSKFGIKLLGTKLSSPNSTGIGGLFKKKLND